MRLAVLGIMVVSLGLECWALRRDLPYADVDEPTFVRPAVHIAATGALDPHWFGHPGSTTIYPLAGLYRVWGVLAHGDPVLSPSPALSHRFLTSPTEFYVIGRMWSIAFTVGAIPLIFVLGRRCFSTAVGLVGASVWAVLPLIVSYGREVRTDSAGVFFAMLSLLLIVRFVDRPSLSRFVVAGASIGIGVASRYFLVTFLAVLVTAGMIVLRHRAPLIRARTIAAGAGAALGAFVLTTPYFFFDWAAARDSLAYENGPQVGHDGFSLAGNLRWYLANAIPNTVSWPVALFAVAGIVLLLFRNHSMPRVLLLGATAIFLVGISTSSLHWDRWPLPILPIVVLFAAYALVEAARAAASARSRALAPAVITGVALVSVLPVKDTVQLNLRETRPSTRVVARRWIEAHVPPGTTVVRELKSAPLAGTDLRVVFRSALPRGGWTLNHYRQDGFRYFITDAGVSGPYTTQPRRYPTEAAFYRQLRQEACLLHQFRPNAERYGPIIRVYELMPTGTGCGTRGEPGQNLPEATSAATRSAVSVARQEILRTQLASGVKTHCTACLPPPTAGVVQIRADAHTPVKLQESGEAQAFQSRTSSGPPS